MIVTVAFYILLVAGHLGFFDVVYFHVMKCRLAERPECQREVIWHTMRHLIYATGGALILLDAQTGQKTTLLSGLGKISEPTWSR